MRRLLIGGAVAAVLLVASGCFGTLVAMARLQDTLTAGTETAEARDWPSSLGGRTHIVDGVYSVNAMGMSNVLWYGPDKYYYKLTFSTWYRSLMSRGGWMEVTSVPSAFRKIPRGHARFRMVKHVPAP